MSGPTRVDIGDAFARGTPIDEAMNEAVRQAVERHRQAGIPLAVWKNGHVEYVPAEPLPPSSPDSEENDPSRR